MHVVSAAKQVALELNQADVSSSERSSQHVSVVTKHLSSHSRPMFRGCILSVGSHSEDPCHELQNFI